MGFDIFFSKDFFQIEFTIGMTLIHTRFYLKRTISIFFLVNLFLFSALYIIMHLFHSELSPTYYHREVSLGQVMQTTHLCWGLLIEESNGTSSKDLLLSRSRKGFGLLSFLWKTSLLLIHFSISARIFNVMCPLGEQVM